jgi:sterol desaturase/sphingolipid hydroxylase (fatty acid hydroxylase superfamily)
MQNLYLKRLYERAVLMVALIFPSGFRTDERGELDPGMWAGLFVSVVILVLIVAALFPTLTTALTNYAGNETTFGPILVIVVPLVIGAAILLGIVAVFLGKARNI